MDVHTGICEKVVLALFKDFACAPWCRNDKDVTSYEGYQKSNPLEDISIKFI